MTNIAVWLTTKISVTNIISQSDPSPLVANEMKLEMPSYFWILNVYIWSGPSLIV